MTDNRTLHRLNVSDSDVEIPIDFRHHPFKFTRWWFYRRNIQTWSTYLYPRYKNQRHVKMLQIGIFEGMDLVWCLQNMLSQESIITAIDPWEQMPPKWNPSKIERVYRRALHNLSPWRDRVSILRYRSQQILRDLPEKSYDLIVVDGAHDAPSVILDGVESLRLAKPGAWIVFDDIRNRQPKEGQAYDGLCALEKSHQDQMRLVWQHRHCDCYERLPDGSV